MKHFKFLGITISLIFVFTNKTYAETWNCGPATDGVYSDSVKCTYDEEAKTLTISGDGPMGNYNRVYINGEEASDTPWLRKDIVHAVIEGNVTTIGNRVFKALYNLEDVTGLENIESVGSRAFYNASSLKSIDLPNVKSVGKNAFLGTSSLEFAGIPTNVTWESSAFAGSKIPNCKTGECGNCGDKFVQAGVGCVSDCFDGYYPTNQGYCKIIKLRYTLPEADAATSDDNENMIEWIFE